MTTGSSDGPVVSDQETDEQMEEDYARIGEELVNRYLEISTPVNASVAVGDVNVSAAGRDFTLQTEEEQARLIRLAVMGNVVRRNRKWVCETYGVPDYVFKEHWSQYLETKKHRGYFFHRDEVAEMAVDEPTDKMRKALEAYNTGGSIDPTTGLPVWQAYKVPRSSYYDCLKWQRENPKNIWSGSLVRNRGKTTILTEEMESELLHWVAISQVFRFVTITPLPSDLKTCVSIRDVLLPSMSVLLIPLPVA